MISPFCLMPTCKSWPLFNLTSSAEVHFISKMLNMPGSGYSRGLIMTALFVPLTNVKGRIRAPPPSTIPLDHCSSTENTVNKIKANESMCLCGKIIRCSSSRACMKCQLLSCERGIKRGGGGGGRWGMGSAPSIFLNGTQSPQLEWRHIPAGFLMNFTQRGRSSPQVTSTTSPASPS